MILDPCGVPGSTKTYPKFVFHKKKKKKNQWRKLASSSEKFETKK
jgi:hypothetical protein